ncbi:hypothetical protein [Brucella anthropi]|uniref:hypothetical protein n=1 Tax=Brucella anthropi TaxID=529 RepID=UPI00384DC1C2
MLETSVILTGIGMAALTPLTRPRLFDIAVDDKMMALFARGKAIAVKTASLNGFQSLGNRNGDLMA